MLIKASEYEFIQMFTPCARTSCPRPSHDLPMGLEGCTQGDGFLLDLEERLSLENADHGWPNAVLVQGLRVDLMCRHSCWQVPRCLSLRSSFLGPLFSNTWGPMFESVPPAPLPAFIPPISSEHLLYTKNCYVVGI